VSEPEIGDVMVRLDELLKELRRQGRAAVAAQAAAESCLEALESREEPPAPPSVDPEADPSAVAERWVRAIAPVVDAVDRTLAQATALAAPRPPAARPLLLRLLRAGAADPPAAARLALVDGLRVLHAQLAAALDGLGVTVDRGVGRPVDPDRQRVVEVRAPRGGERAGVVVEVVRAGFAIGPRVVREAEVVATGGAADKEK
jgi:GrpE